MNLTNVMIHHTGTSLSKNKDQFKATNNYHRGKWNFRSSLGYYVGYTYQISGRGRVRKARRVGETTAACYQKSMNDGRCIHIALDGNFDIENPTPPQIFALRDLLIELHNKYKISKGMLVAHSEFAPKSCPGQNFDMQFIRNLIPGKVKKINNKELILKKLEEIKKLL